MSPISIRSGIIVASSSPPAYAFLGSTSSGSAGNTTTFTLAATMNGNTGKLVVAVGIQNGIGITSVVYDPGGDNVTLVNDVALGTGDSAIYSGNVTGFSGSKNIVVTFGANIQFLVVGVWAWLATNLTSTAAQQTVQTVGSVGATITPGAATGYLMFGLGFFVAATASADYSTTTPQVPTGVHPDAGTFGAAADWLVNSNALYTIVPKPGVTAHMAYATYK